MNKISVVIPVYNIENYIEACVETVVNQAFEGFEVLLVDDGSTDSSGGICDSFALRNENVKVFHKQNGGLSDARNYGLEKANGKYVLFVDGDDTISEGALEELFNDAEKAGADMVIGKAVLAKPSAAMERFESIAEKNFEPRKPYTGKEYLTGCLEGGALRVEVWRSLYLREFLLKNNLNFKCGIVHEDEHFTPRALLKAHRVVLTDVAFYCYNNARGGSIMNTNELNSKKICDKKLIYGELLEIYKNVTPKKLKRLLEDDISWKYIDCFSVCGKEEMKKYGVQRLLPLKTAYTLKRRVKAVLFAICPGFFAK